jgi:hypothetical protein
MPQQKIPGHIWMLRLGSLRCYFLLKTLYGQGRSQRLSRGYTVNRRSFLGLSLKGAVLGLALSTGFGRAALSVIGYERRVILEIFSPIDAIGIVDNLLPLGVNGNVMVVPCGQVVDIPYRFYEVLKNSVRKTHFQPADEEPCYPHHVHKFYDKELVEPA